ncbi:MAG: hypothetical protein AAGC77_00645 [Pseudomonadota bacterium]
MRFGLFVSLVFHALLLGGGVILVLPEAWRPNVEPEPYIPLELIREAELDLTTSVPAARPEEPEPEPEEPDLPEEPEPEPEPQPTIEEEPAPEPEPEPAPEPEPEPEPEPKPEPKPEPPKEPELDLGALEDSLSTLIDKEREETTARNAPSETAETAEDARPAIGAGDRLTASEEDKMRAAVARCWNASAIVGAPEPEKLIVTIEFELNTDGTLSSAPRVANATQINLSGNRFWKVAEQTALRAVNLCAPYDFLPVDRYDTWKEFRLNFDPSLMAGF